MSKVCEERKSCQICSATHPTLLHIKQKPRGSPKEEASKEEPEDESLKEEQKTQAPRLEPGVQIVSLPPFL